MGSWKERGSSFVWIRDALPLDAPELRIWTYGYSSDVRDEGSVSDVFEWAHKFQSRLNTLRKYTRVSSRFLLLMMLGASCLL